MRLTLLLEEVYGIEPLNNVTVLMDRHHPDPYYSREVLDVLSPDAVASLPFPSLGSSTRACALDPSIKACRVRHDGRKTEYESRHCLVSYTS